MTKPKVETEPQVTAEDLQHKWDEIKHVAKDTAQRRVLGMAPAVLAGVAVGAGALGLAFWLGRRSAARSAEPDEAAMVGVEPAHRVKPKSALAKALEPALASAVNAVVEAGARQAVTALTNRLRA